MPRLRDSGYPVVNTLKELSEVSDRFADEFPLDSAVDAWLASVKETFNRLRDCSSILEVKYPPDISTVFAQNSNKFVKVEVPETHKSHVHDDKNTTTEKDKSVDKQTAEVVAQTSKASKTPKCKQKTEVVVQTPKFSKTPKCKQKTEVAAQTPKDMKPPICIITESLQENNQVHPKDSEACVVASSNKILAPSRTPTLQLSYTPKINALKSFNKSTLLYGDTNSMEEIQTPVMDKTFAKHSNLPVSLNSAKSHNSTNFAIPVDKTCTSSGIKTRSSSKRKSSVSRERSIKKKKICKDIPSTSATKPTYSRIYVDKPVSMKVVTTKAHENRNKLSAVIVPPLPAKQTPVISKEKQIMEEIKKKEKKANENRRRVLAERQLKADESKKKREEKREKIIEKRQQLEKEKEMRDMEDKRSQPVKEIIKSSEMKSRVKELIDQNAKENKLASPKQGNTYAPVVVKTPISQKSKHSETYELTPAPDSSTYDFSDGEDDRPAGKQVPLWAQSVQLRSALIQELYQPTDTDELFGTHVDVPDLAEIFNVQKKKYKVRTSSAVWNTTPERSFRC